MAALGDEAGELQRDRHVHIVAAGMHHTGAPRPKRHIRRFLEGKAVHIGSDQDRTSRPLPADLRHHAGPGDARRQFVDAERIQSLGDVVRGLSFLEAQLR